MTLSTEKQSIKFRGVGADGEDFPIPFSFRHSDNLKVETIDSGGVATQKTLNSHYTLVQLSDNDVPGTGTASITCILDGSGIPAALHNETITIVSNTGVSKVYQFSNTDITSGTMVGLNVGVRVYEVTTKAGVVTQIQAAINHANGHGAAVFPTGISSNVLTLNQVSTPSYSQNSTITLSSGLSTTTEVSKKDFDNRTNVISNNSQRTDHGWIKWVGVSTTDIVHIYKEETPLQPTDYAHSASGEPIPRDKFEQSKIRLTEAYNTTLSRSDNDPTSFSAQDRRISVGSPLNYDDALTKGVLDNMKTTASLTIPAAGSTADNGKLVVPTALAPSTPTIGYANRLARPSPAGGQDDYLLSATDPYDEAPYVEWTAERWIKNPPDNGLQWCVNYDVDTGITKTMEWREFRPAPTIDLGTNMEGFFLLMTDATTKTSEWTRKNNDRGQLGEKEGTAVASHDAAFHRVGVSDSNILNWSPRMTNTGSIELTLNMDDCPLPEPDGETGQSTEIHPVRFGFTISNTMVNDSGNRVAPDMLFYQIKTFPVTVSPGGVLEDFTAYPVFAATHVPLLYGGGDADETADANGNLKDRTNDHDFPSRLMCMNRTQRYVDEFDSDSTDGSKDFIWSGDKTAYAKVLQIYDSTI